MNALTTTERNELNRLMRKIRTSKATVREFRRALELQEKEEAAKPPHHDLDDAKVGDGATYTIHTDSKAGTIIKRTAKTIWWQRDKATLLNGMNSDAEDKLTCSVGGFAGHVEGRQRYAYERDEDGSIVKFSRREITNPYSKKTRVVWKRCGHGTKSPGCTLNVGRNEHYDYNY